MTDSAPAGRRTTTEQVADALPHVVWLATPQGAVTYLNAAGRAYAGVDPRGGHAVPLVDLIHPDDVTRFTEALASATAGTELLEVEVRLCHLGDRYRWNVIKGAPITSSSGRIRQWLGTCTDVDDRHAALEAMHESREAAARAVAMLDTLQASAPIGMAFVDRELRFVKVNKAYADIVGLPPGDFRGRTVADVVPWLWPTVEPWYRHVLSTGTPLLNADVSGDRGPPLGRGHWLGSYYPVELEGGLAGVGVMVTDITARRLLEERLATTQKMEALGTLARGIVHDFKNLLAVISMTTELARFRTEDKATLEDLDRIAEATEASLRLSNQLLLFAREQRTMPVPIDLGAVVDGLTEMLGRTLGSHIELTVEVTDPLPEVVADRAQLEQMVVNLAVNARDAMPDGGRLHIAVRVVQQPRLSVELVVNDTGVGMDEAVRTRAIEPFFTTKGRENNGLGLATVYAVVDEARGALEIRSAPGEGTTVVARLPAATP